MRQIHWPITITAVIFVMAQLDIQYVDVYSGFLILVALFVTLLIQGSRRYPSPIGVVLILLSVLPLVRLISLGTSPLFLGSLGYTGVVEGSLLLACVVATVVMPEIRGKAILGWRCSWWDMPSVLSGVVAGWMESTWLLVQPLAAATSLGSLALPIGMLLLAAFAEEWFTRGLLFSGLRVAVGPWAAIAYTALYGVIMLVSWASPMELVFGLVLGLGWGYLRYRGASVWGLTVGHAASNIVLFLVLPSVHGIL